MSLFTRVNFCWCLLWIWLRLSVISMKLFSKYLSSDIKIITLLNFAIKLFFLDKILLDLTENLFMVLFLLVFLYLIARVHFFQNFLFILEFVHLENQMVDHIIVVWEQIVQLTHGFFVLQSIDSAQLNHDFISLL